MRRLPLQLTRAAWKQHPRYCANPVADDGQTAAARAQQSTRSPSEQQQACATQVIAVPPPQRDDPAAAAEHKLKGDAAYRAGLFEVNSSLL
jgi:hypothetical protein